jgi:hypothetical protein
MKLTLIPILVLLAVATAASAYAAPATGTRDKYKQVRVTQTRSGEELKGEILELSAQSLAILVNNRRVEVPLDDVLRIEIRGDSLRNGAAIGAAILGGLSLLTCQGYESGGACVVGAAVNLGLGAIIGAGVDALNGGRTTIYSKPAAAGSPGPTARVAFKLRF